MQVSFTIPGQPVGKGRPRFTRSGVIYTPERTKKYERLVKECYREQCGNINFGTTSIALYVKAYVTPLTKFRKAEKLAALKGELKPIAKPDADNILKVILDALNEVAYDDDRYIYKIEIERIYSETPHIDVIIRDQEKIEQLQKDVCQNVMFS